MPVLSLLKDVAPFSYLDEKTLKELVPHLQEQTFPRNSYVFKQNQPSLRKLFIVLSGVAEVIVTNEKSIDSVVALRRVKEFFGETVFLTDKNYPASVKAVEDLHCVIIPKEVFEDLISKFPAVANFFTKMLGDRLRDMFQEVVIEQSYEAYGMEAQPFRKRVIDIMSSPVVTCSIKNNIFQVAQILTEKNISALVVVDENNSPVGLITEKDLVSKVLTKSECLDIRLTADKVMSPNLISLPPEAFFYQALLAMVRNQIRHVAVVDQGRLMGIVTVRDLMKSRATGTLTIVDDIETRDSITGLIEASKEVDKVLTALIAEKAGFSEICEVITEFYDRLTRKTIEISLQEMLDEGHGSPPVPFCWITMGSGGRKEQTSRTDQDNGIIYEDVPEDKAEVVSKYFHLLATKIVNGLIEIGFAKCKGNVMATNPEWCKPLREWELTVNRGIAESVPDMIRQFTIFLDFRPIYGDRNLSAQLHQYVFRVVKESPIILHFLAKDDLANGVPLGFFRQFITDKSGEHKDEFDLKRSVCVHVVDCIRIFAIRESISETSTLGRLRELANKEILNKEDVELFDTAYETLMMFRIRENQRKLSLGLHADNYINPYKLTKKESTVLKEAIMAVDRLQNFTGSVFRVEGY
ncbi:MAG: DUF294 nucleotidyltransferase-like domain-containing protein [Clostridia bacterium]|nr:DUF294 nucleotidyltransferase-like domain-containing protein [Clostridia bacterium]